MAGVSAPKNSPQNFARSEFLTYLLCLITGLSTGWLIWGRQANEHAISQQKGQTERKILLPEKSDSSALIIPDGVTAAQTKCFQALAVIDPDFRFAEFMVAVKDMRPADAPAVFKKFKEEFRQEKTPNREWEAFLHRWGEIDPTGSLKYAMSRDTANAQGYFLKHFLEGWARTDYQAAVQWLNDRPNVPEWDGAFAGLLRGMASKDPWLASQTAIVSIPEDATWLRDNTVSYVASAIMRSGGPGELKKWFASIPSQTKSEAKFKEKAMHVTAMHLDHADKEMARQWLVTQPVEPWRSDAAYHLVARKWAKDDPAAALNWLSGLAAGKVPVRPAAGKEIYQEWSDEKPEDAGQWAKTVNNPAFLKFIGALKVAPRQR